MLSNIVKLYSKLKCVIMVLMEKNNYTYENRCKEHSVKKISKIQGVLQK